MSPGFTGYVEGGVVMKCKKVLINMGILLALALITLVHQPTLYFFIGFTSIHLACRLVLINSKDMDEQYKKTNHAPEWVDMLFYLVMIGILLYGGHWGIAILWFLLGSIDLGKRS